MTGDRLPSAAPGAIRLLTVAKAATAPRPPFGLDEWSTEAAAIAVFLDASGLDVGEAAVIARQIPHATELPAGTLVVVLGVAARDAGGIWRWLQGRTIAVARAPRCTALVGRGYVDVGAGVDPKSRIDLAWGVSSLC